MPEPIQPQEALPSTITKLPIQEGLQRAGINQLFQQGLQYFNPATQEEYTRKQFAKQLPGFYERFNALGGGQGMSQAAQHELGGLQANLENQILGQRYQHGLSALKLGLTPQYEYLYKEPPLSFGQSLAQNLATSLAEKAPDLIGKGAQYIGGKLVDKFGNPVKEGQTTGEKIAETAAGTATGVATGKAVDALTTAKTAEEGAKTAVENQTAQKLAQEAATGAAGTAGAVGTKGAIGALTKTGTAAGAAALAPFAVALGVPLALAATGFIGIKAYEYYQDLMKQQFGTSIPPLPANFLEMAGPERYKEQLSRQITTPGGQVSHDEIEALERSVGIKANGSIPWEERYRIALAKKGK